MQSLALDYEEPIVVPDSPPLMNAPSLSIPKDTSFASALGFEKIGLSTNTQIDRQNEIDDNESKIYPQSSSIRSTRASTREAKLKDALARTEENLKVALQDAQLSVLMNIRMLRMRLKLSKRPKKSAMNVLVARK
ncbi:hypothetical protein C8R41DRAFT_870998 [Lentinula lateritia]|uniref:Uncharacterized protein n=1 Tax=Lentinula lateritia TaxID=40482 RepID=A0ABQ8V7L0_9AGAR|nr:hypothetical protein C8R41DRAFT_870998 [Lentinula lateritia]